MAEPNPTTNLQRVEFRLSDEQVERLDRIAHELSEPGPGGRVTRADVLREAVNDFDLDPETESLSEGLLGQSNSEEVDA